MWNIQRGTISRGSNAAGNASVYGPSVADIRNVEVQKTPPAESVAREDQSSETEESPKPKTSTQRRVNPFRCAIP
jgi:hypothetical protein